MSDADERLTTSFSLRPKERLQHLGAAPSQHASSNLHPMVGLRVIHDCEGRKDRARLFIIGPINQAFYACMNQRTRAHGAWFNCSKQLAVFQAMVADSRSCVTQSDDFSMCAGI